MTSCYIVFVRPTSVYRHINFQFWSFRRSGDTRAILKFRIRSRDRAPHSLWPTPHPSIRMQNLKYLASAVPEIGGGLFKTGPPPPLWGDQDPRLIQCSMGPQECSPQTASWSVQPFLHSETEISRVTDRQTDRQTPRTSVRIDFISCIRCSLKGGATRCRTRHFADAIAEGEFR